MITQDKWQKLRQWMAELDIKEDDLDESFILASGRGGQKVQKTASCVHLKHLPTENIIKCSDSRSREHNRYKARIRLCEKIEAEALGVKSKQQQAIEKIKRQKRRRSRRAKNKMLDDKSHQAKVKARRQKPSRDDL